MGTDLLVGRSSTFATNQSSANKFRMGKFQAAASGTAETLGAYIYQEGSGNPFKLAIYADNAGSPGTLLAYTAEFYGVGSIDWEDAALNTSISIVSGTYYWLAFAVKTDAVVYVESGVGTNLSKVIDYSTFSFPNPAGSLDSFTYQPLLRCRGTISSSIKIPVFMNQYRQRRR